MCARAPTLFPCFFGSRSVRLVRKVVSIEIGLLIDLVSRCAIDSQRFSHVLPFGGFLMVRKLRFNFSWLQVTGCSLIVLSAVLLAVAQQPAPSQPIETRTPRKTLAEINASITTIQSLIDELSRRRLALEQERAAFTNPTVHSDPTQVLLKVTRSMWRGYRENDL